MHDLPAVASPQFDLIVIGAGINGAGIARDATLRGLRVLLLDKGDVGSGTTSWSTRLIHGGLRYLEHGEIGLVRESLTERGRLLRMAPHLVRPLPLLLPVYRGDKRGLLLIRAGMAAYDALSWGKSLPRHRVLDRDAALRRAPGLAKEGLRGAALYYDAQVTYPERLALENALAARDLGASLRTYHQVDDFDVIEGRVAGVRGRDATGSAFGAAAPVIVNAAGPWVDAVIARTPVAESCRLIGGTKGSHIVVSPFPGAPADALYVETRRDGRPFFIVPWNGLYLIGTTDDRFEGDLDRVVADDGEIALLLEETNRVIPSARLSREDVRYAYAGVRPLPYAPAQSEASVTRRHIVRDHGTEGGPRGLISIVGGKLTTYRELAEQTVDLVMRKLGRPPLSSATAEIPLPGARRSGDSWQHDFIATAGLPLASAEHLLRVYGARAPELLATAITPESRRVFDPLSGAIAAEVSWAFQVEGARTLTDVIARRTMSGLNRDAGVGADQAAARIARGMLGWDAARAESEVAAYRRWVSRYQPRALSRVH